jgi:hypothetical protein
MRTDAITSTDEITITPVTCFASDCRTDYVMMMNVLPLAIVLIGVLVINRWRDVLVVGAVATLSIFFAAWLFGDLPRSAERFAEVIGAFLIYNAIFLSITIVLFAAKRSVAWLATRFRRRTQAA